MLQQNLKRTNLYHQTYDITKWNHILARMSELLNNRPLSVRFINETLLSVTPNRLLHGQRGGEFPRDLEMDFHDNRLYHDLSKLESSLEEWRKVWAKTYLQEIQRFLTFKNSSKRELKVGSIVLISDHLNKITRFPALGRVLEKVSPRTFKLEYVKKEAVCDKDMKIMKPAVCAVLTRPIQNLIWLCDPEENEFVTLDPFTPTNDPEDIGVSDDGNDDDHPSNEEEEELTTEMPIDENPDDTVIESVRKLPELPERRQRKNTIRYGID